MWILLAYFVLNAMIFWSLFVSTSEFSRWKNRYPPFREVGSEYGVIIAAGFVNDSGVCDPGHWTDTFVEAYTGGSPRFCMSDGPKMFPTSFYAKCVPPDVGKPPIDTQYTRFEEDGSCDGDSYVDEPTSGYMCQAAGKDVSDSRYCAATGYNPPTGNYLRARLYGPNETDHCTFGSRSHISGTVEFIVRTGVCLDAGIWENRKTSSKSKSDDLLFSYFYGCEGITATSYGFGDHECKNVVSKGVAGIGSCVMQIDDFVYPGGWYGHFANVMECTQAPE